MNSFNVLGTIFSSANLGEYQYLATIVNFLDQAIIPFTVVLLVATAIFAVCLAFAMIKAETGEKQQEHKKRLIGLVVTVLIITVSIWLLGFFLANFADIMGAIRGMGAGITG